MSASRFDLSFTASILDTHASPFHLYVSILTSLLFASGAQNGTFKCRVSYEACGECEVGAVSVAVAVVDQWFALFLRFARVPWLCYVLCVVVVVGFIQLFSMLLRTFICNCGA